MIYDNSLNNILYVKTFVGGNQCDDLAPNAAAVIFSCDIFTLYFIRETSVVFSIIYYYNKL